jgi:quercetin 2,3-dioxygenase
VASQQLTIRRGNERGKADHGWLRSFHTFSFADYYDPAHMNFRALRVINEDRVRPGRGFGTHPHRDMEIISYVLEGALQHQDSMGNGSIIRPGDVQRMSAGTGVLHSEQNPSKTEDVHFLQIWVVPESKDLPPSYEQRSFSAADRAGRLRLLASRDGHDGSVVIHQDVELYAGLLEHGQRVLHETKSKGRHVWVQVARGAIELRGERLAQGDAAALDGGSIEIAATEPSEVLLFELA